MTRIWNNIRGIFSKLNKYNGRCSLFFCRCEFCCISYVVSEAPSLLCSIFSSQALVSVVSFLVFIRSQEVSWNSYHSQSSSVQSMESASHVVAAQATGFFIRHETLSFLSFGSLAVTSTSLQSYESLEFSRFPYISFSIFVLLPPFRAVLYMAILFLLVYFIRFSFLAESSVARPGPLVVCAVVQRIVQVHASDSVAAALERSLMFVDLHGWCETLMPSSPASISCPSTIRPHLCSVYCTAFRCKGNTVFFELLYSDVTTLCSLLVLLKE